MRYKSFAISNFKGITDITVGIDRLPSTPVFAMVGLNESGKTTILEALDWLFSPKQYDPHQIIPKAKMLSFTGTIYVEAALKLSDQDEQVIARYVARKHKKFEVISKIGDLRIRRSYDYDNSTCTDRRIEYQFSFQGKSKQMHEPKEIEEGDSRWDTALEYIKESLLPPIIYYQNFLFDFPDKIYLELTPATPPKTKPAEVPQSPQAAPPATPPQPVAPSPPPTPLDPMNEVFKEIIHDVLRAINPTYTIQKLLIDRYHSGKSHDLNSIESALNKMSSTVTQAVFGIWNDLLKIDEAAGMEVTFGDSLKADDTGIYLEVKIKEQDDSYYIRERSLGFRWFFAFFLFTHFRAYRYKEKPNALFLLDEPASNLHSSAQAKLLGVFEDLPYRQTIIYATHSHHMINPKWLAGTFVVKNSARNYSQIGVDYTSNLTEITATPYYEFASMYPKDTDYFRPILDSLDYQPSQLEFTPEMVLLEGRNDYYTLRYMKEAGHVKTSVERFLYPGAGKDKVDYIISLYLGWAKNIVVLLDDDKGGRETYNRLMDDFGIILENRVFRLNHVDSAFKGKAMEQIFIDPDPLKITRATFPKATEYSKSQFNTAIQDCWINKQQLTLHKYTVQRFEKLFKFLETKLQENRPEVA